MNAGCDGPNGMHFLHGPELGLPGQSNIEVWALMKDAASWIAIGAALVSACVGLYGIAGSDLRNEVERLFPLMHEQTPWAAWAAIAAAVSVVAQAMEKLPV